LQPIPRAHTIRLKVRQRDTDFLGIVYNPVYLDYAMEAAFQHVETSGCDLEPHRVGGYFVVRRNEIEYRRSARAGDELLVTTAITSMRGRQATRATTIVDVHTGAVVANAVTDYVWLRNTGRPGHIPATLLAAFGFANEDGRTAEADDG